MSAVSQSQPSPALLGADTKAEPAASVDYAVVNRFGVTIATADSEDLARATARRLSLRFSALRVERVTVTIKREVIYRPRQAVAS